ncbi:MAG: hypothetical protein ACE5E2_03940 [Candidatus Binatia bacterium]
MLTDLPEWIVRRIDQARANEWTGQIGLNFHKGEIGALEVMERITKKNGDRPQPEGG